MAQEKFKRNLAAIHSTDVVGYRPSGNNIMEGIKMKCPKCQFENREGIKFCEECGAKFELKCPACQASIPAHSKQLGLSAVGGHPVKARSGKAQSTALASGVWVRGLDEQWHLHSKTFKHWKAITRVSIDSTTLDTKSRYHKEFLEI